MSPTELHIQPTVAHHKDRPFLVAGPCSAESEEQVHRTVRELVEHTKVDVIRAGVWKPRTRPGSFEGIGTPALKWLDDARKAFGIPLATEVANAEHVEWALKHDIEYLWLGARTTVNPFYVQEIADALRGTDRKVWVKNPLHPDIGLWIGALERINRAGIQDMAAVHRGFFAYESKPYRNEPKWEISLEMRRLAPSLPILCDPSHIAGTPALIGEVSQTALDLNMDGLMIESHWNPKGALSDAQQQVTPGELGRIMSHLVLRSSSSTDALFLSKLKQLRERIDEIDSELIDVLAKRIRVVEELGAFKKEKNVAVFQLDRWFEILETRKDWGEDQNLYRELVEELFKLIHKYSIRTQTDMTHRVDEEAHS